MSEDNDQLQGMKYHLSIKQSAKGEYYLGNASVFSTDLLELQKDLDEVLRIAVQQLKELNTK